MEQNVYVKQSNRPKRKKVSTSFSKNLHEILEKRGVSQKAASELAGVRPSVINDWLSGSNPSDLHAVHRLSEGLGVDFSWLLLGILQSSPKGTSLRLEDVFDVQDASDFSGAFLIEAKRLRPKK